MVGGAVGGVVVTILLLLVVGVVITLVMFIVSRSKRKAKNNPVMSSTVFEYEFQTITGIIKSVHSLNPPHQDDNIVGSVKSEGTNIPTVTNESYSTSHLPLPSCVHQQQDMQLSQNQAYVTSASVSMKPNESYGTTTTSMESDLLYATVEGNTTPHTPPNMTPQ